MRSSGWNGVLPSHCPRCGEPAGDGLCDRCAAYVLTFDPFAVRPGLPGPPVDRDVSVESAWLTLDREEPVRFGKPTPRREDDAFAVQFLRHLGLPDGGTAILTRGDRAVLHRLMRRWARAPPEEEPLKSMVRGLYAEAASLAEMPAPIAQAFESLAEASRPLVVEIPPPTPAPESQPEPEMDEDLPPVAPTEPRDALGTTTSSPPPPPKPESQVPLVLAELRADLDARKDELVRWLADERREMDRREGLMHSQLDEVRRREKEIAAKQDAIAEAERRLRAHAAEVQRKADKARAEESRRSLFFFLFSMDGVGREAAKELSEAFVTEARLRSASLREIAAVPGVPPEQAALIHDAFAGDGNPVRRDLREKAWELLESGQADVSLEVFDELVRLTPEDVEAWLNRSEVLALLGKIGEAIASYERVLELDPGHRAARSELANLMFEHGEFGGAAAQLADLLRDAPHLVDHWLGRATGLLAEGKTTEATLIYNAVLDADPANLTASLSLGDMLLAMGDAETADREYTRALQHHPDDPVALLKKGLLLNRQGRWGAAVQLFNRAISVRWDYREAWAAKGQVLLAQGKPIEALACFDRLLGFDGKRKDAWVGKAESHFALGENDKAAEAAGHALSLDESDDRVRELLNRFRESVDRPHEAVEVIALPPAETIDHGAPVEMADALLEAGDPDGALRVYGDILARSPKDARAWSGKGRALHALGRYEEAIPCFTAASEIDPVNEEYARWLEVCSDRWRKESA